MSSLEEPPLRMGDHLHQQHQQMAPPILQPSPMNGVSDPSSAIQDGRNGSKCRIDLEEAKGMLASLSLTSVTFGRFLLVMRSECDVIIAGEPYVALMLWLDVQTGKFITRVWNQSISTGDAATLDQFVEACQTHFGQGKFNGSPVSVGILVGKSPKICSNQPP